MATYTFQQLKDIWIMAGGPPDVANIAAAIAIGESGGRSDATANEPDGSVSRGLWQINSVHGSKSSYDITTNARAAVELYKSKGGKFTDWTVYNKGIYRQFLNGTPDISGATNVAVMNPLDILPNPLDALKDIVEQFKTVIKAGEWFANPHNVIRIVQVVMGGFLIVAGIVILNQALVLHVAEKVEPIVRSVATKGVA